MTRVSELAHNVRFTASYVVHALATDPAWLVLQASRRLPARVSAVVVPGVERLVGDGAGGAAGRLRAAWAAGDVTTVRDAAPRGRTGRRVRAALLGQVATLEPTGTDEPTSPDRSAPSAPVAVHHHLTNSLPHTQSGYTLRSHAILTAQRAAGHRVTATTRVGYPLTIGALGARRTDVVDGVGYARLVPRSLPADHARRAEDGTALLAAELERHRPDVVHATTPWTTGAAARAAAERAGLPWVYEVRGLPEETWAASHATAAAREAATRSERYALVRAKETELALAADHVVTLSATMRDELVGRGVPAERITVVPNAVDSALLDATAPTPAEARAALGLRTAPQVVGTVSSLVGYEGLDTILRTVATLRDGGTDVSALVVGDGVARPGLLRLAAELGIAEHVHLPGRVPRDVARTYLAALDVVLVPRRPDRVTGLVTPLKPVEAMATGRPVVASDLPALREVCSPLDGGAPAALLVPADDQVAWVDAVGGLLGDAARQKALVAAGRDVAAERTWSQLVARYDDAYAAATGAPLTDENRKDRR
ncbi:glycosyltransferase [Isoptericola sp. S6320L]|uniref:glycosyltransferase n=1 Tax=Isoptericola sp. S6320L TaxID=2926411 RepID=UPI001FF4B035|nr:glycosyltransferase [Isoptericola sp. S6320L]MCK0116271.1 glycosyltransferase [Isoptericola sp. S6320L]